LPDIVSCTGCWNLGSGTLGRGPAVLRKGCEMGGNVKTLALAIGTASTLATVDPVLTNINEPEKFLARRQSGERDARLPIHAGIAFGGRVRGGRGKRTCAFAILREQKKRRSSRLPSKWGGLRQRRGGETEPVMGGMK